MTCEGDWEVRQPQDFVRGVADIQAPPYVRPEQSNSFLPYFFTQYPDEQINPEERIQKQFTKIVGDIYVGGRGVVNGTDLNSLSLNGTDANNFINPDNILFTESYFLVLGRSLSDSVSMSESVSRTIVKSLVESISIADTVQLVETEAVIEGVDFSESISLLATHAAAESVGVSESVSTLLVTATPVNGSALNSLALD